MKHVLIAAGFAMSATTGVFANDDSKMPEHIGFGSGAAVGAAVAGPVGVVIGGTLGALIGHDVVQERVLARPASAAAYARTSPARCASRSAGFGLMAPGCLSSHSA